MIIRTQDKSTIIKAVKIYFTNEIGSKKFYIFANSARFGLFSSQTTLGIYYSQEECIKQIDAIFNFFNENPDKIYQMP